MKQKNKILRRKDLLYPELSYQITRKNIEQIYSYLKATNLKLGILANFTKTGLRFKRIVNLT